MVVAKGWIKNTCRLGYSYHLITKVKQHWALIVSSEASPKGTSLILCFLTSNLNEVLLSSSSEPCQQTIK